MTDLSQLGTWEIAIEACSMQLYTCTETNYMTIVVKDPCTVTTINTQPITERMVARVGEPAALQVTGWPYSDSVDSSLDSYGTGKCGAIKATVTYEDGTPCEFASFDKDNGTIIVDPDN